MYTSSQHGLMRTQFRKKCPVMVSVKCVTYLSGHLSGHYVRVRASERPPEGIRGHEQSFASRQFSRQSVVRRGYVHDRHEKSDNHPQYRLSRRKHRGLGGTTHFHPAGHTQSAMNHGGMSGFRCFSPTDRAIRTETRTICPNRNREGQA